ncbi:MAG: YedE family putative selenium transporter [Sulfurospirillaceae bacterium]|nr:YedE family putative selenium transporter [Sulfurospirillaceae bacterium]MCK9545116.1 YedE family putative selenium transporter [Sulfurospirillaceae bacterium]MDY0238540.1 YedE family putative selenium transporter [Campylobacterales bacterium]
MRKLAYWPIAAGVIFGIVAPLLATFGNPGNMGMCAACFLRDISGALGFHNAAIVQYIRPEIIGLILGAFVSALLFKEFRPRAGSAPIARFFLGIFAMIGALVFLGCPWRMFLRLSAGDWTALAGLVGLMVGIFIGVYFFKKGFSLGRNRPVHALVGYLMPVFGVALFALLLWGMYGDANLVKFSAKGPGAMHAPLLISLIVGLLLGFVFQKSRFCTIAAARDTILLKETHILQGLIAFVFLAFITNLVLGQVNPGFENQPIAHNDALWNFLGMLLSGLALTLAGGCPGRQLVLSGEGDTDAGIFIMGLLMGAAIAHNFNLASSPAGITANAPFMVFAGLIFCIVLGIFAKERR